MKLARRVLSAAILIVAAMVMGYLTYTGSRLPYGDSVYTEAVYEQEESV